MKFGKNITCAAVIVVLTVTIVYADFVTRSITVGTNPYAVAVNPVTNKIYVANYVSGNVTAIDAANYYNTATITVGSFPRAIAVNALTNKIYVANYGSSSVTVIDGATNTTSNVSVEATPCAIAVNGTTNRIYVAHYSTGHVTVIDGATDQVSDSVQTGTGPIGLCINPVTNKIYVANSGSNSVTVIDGATNDTVTVSVGTTPTFVAANTVTNKIYVSNSGSGSVTVINGATNGTTAITAGTNPGSIAVNMVRDMIYVANYGSNNVTVIDGTTGSVAAVATVGTNPTAVAVNATTNKIYVANYNSNNTMSIDGVTNDTATVAAGTNPCAVAVNPVINKIYVVNYGGNNITIIDGATSATASVVSGKNSIAVAVNPVTNKIYVADSSSNSITVIDGATNDTATVAAGTNPHAVAVNPVTNKIYVANFSSNNVTVIDGATNSTATIAAGTNPYAVAVNPVTNKIYVANYGSNDITVIYGATNAAATVVAGTKPRVLAVNPVTNKIYVANENSNNVTVIDGATNLVATVAAGTRPYDIAVNPVTNKIYVANLGPPIPPAPYSYVTVIDGATNGTTTISGGIMSLCAVAVNPVTNKIYVANPIVQNILVIDGATNTTLSVSIGRSPYDIAVNPVTNKIYVANQESSNTIAVIDGATTRTAAIFTIYNPRAVAVNPVTNKIYVVFNSDNVPVIDEDMVCDTRLQTFFDSLPANSTRFAQPTLTGKAINRLRPGHSGVSKVLSLMSTSQLSWGNASITNGAGTDSASWTWTWGTDTLLWGENFLCAVALDSQSGTTNNSGLGTPFAGNMTVYPIYRIADLPATPVLVSPLNNSIDQPTTVTFVWNRSAGASSYLLQIATDTGFSSIIAQYVVLDTSKTGPSLAGGISCYWRVCAINIGGASAWSTVWGFSTIAIPQTPILSSPANGATNVINPTLFWHTTVGALSYSVEVSTASNFSSLTASDSNITDTSYTVTGLSPLTRYYWHVRAFNLKGTSSWSLVWNFTTVDLPQTPTLSLPANGAIGVSTNPVLSWNIAARASTYAVQVSTASDFSSLAVDDSGITLTADTVSGLSPFGFYYWRVRAVNAGGSSGWSAVWNFTTGTTGISSFGSSIPRVFSITGSSGTIHYSLPRECLVRLKYYDLRGRLIASLMNTTQAPGYYSLSVKDVLPSYSSYLMSFEAGSFVKRQMIIKE